eukprot:6197051-Pleurochrysis_carterae.AAC.1
MHLLHDDEPDKVHCRFWWPGLPTDRLKYHSNQYEVVKTHEWPINFEEITKMSWLFTTFDPHQNQSSITDKALAAARYVQNYVDLMRRGYLLLTDYQRVFSLSDEELGYLLEYMRYWSILRQCCGVQMSSDWRAKLQNVTNRTWHHGGPTSIDYPACEMYDLDVVESSLLASYVYRRYHSYNDALRKVSDHDDDLTGKYCTRTNRMVAQDA